MHWIFEGDRHYFNYLHHSFVSGQTPEKKNNPAHQKKIGLKTTEHGSAHQNKTTVSLTVILSQQKASISLLCLSIEVLQNENHNHRKLKQLITWTISSVQFSSVTQSCPAFRDPMNHSTPGFPVYHQFPELAQTHVHRICDAIQLSHPLSSPSPPAHNPSQHQGLFQ